MMETFVLEINERGKGELVLHADNEHAGKMDILVRNGLLTVYHTEVAEKFAGRGYAKLLLDELTPIARKQNLMIKPLCPYVHAQFKRHPEIYNDLWFKDN